jgi:SAM-dependent methyltransferase
MKQMLRSFLRRSLSPAVQPAVDRLDKKLAARLKDQDRQIARLSTQLKETLRQLRRLSPKTQRESRPTPEREVAFPDELFARALLDPEEVRSQLQQVARARFGESAEIGTNVRVQGFLDRIVPVPHGELFADAAGALIADATDELIEALRDFSLDVFTDHLGPHVGYDLAGYLRQTRIRVIAAVRELRRRGVSRGRILDVGSLYGVFALPLQRLGYQVTVVDRYREYSGLETVVERLEAAGATVVSTARSDEVSILNSLSEYDVVISMAVIEHIPHTPRLFLEGLRRHVRKGGLLILDTPNLVKYWNRVGLSRGRSMFMDLKSQYYSQVPFEGHHREYTGEEVRWMLEQIGCSDIRVQYLESNIFQFESIDRPHLECLLAIVQDPTQADTILASALV